METKHSKSDLKQMQSLPLDAKIEMTKRRIREWYDNWEGMVYVSFSGGKDSTVLKHIVDGMYDDIPAVFVNTGLEYPEIQQFVKEIKAGKYDCFNTDVEIIRPEMRFDEVIQKYGYPVASKEVSQIIREARVGLLKGDGSYAYRIAKLRGELKDKNGNPSIYNQKKWEFLLDAPFAISEQCCNVMKKKPAKEYEKRTWRKAIIGTMATESRLRQQRWIRYGCNAFGDKRGPTSNPLSFWTEQDVLHYIKRYNVPYCPVYGDIRVKRTEGTEIEGQINLIDCLGCYEPEDTLETTGCDRTGCMFCMFGCHLEKEPNRFQRMKQTHPRQYAYCMDKLGLREVLEYIGVPYE
jgi:3'-phosphoadenosine 5'-phosphosulfate sulfotransferase (PAPS reductase)/FAD synthetase